MKRALPFAFLLVACGGAEQLPPPAETPAAAPAQNDAAYRVEGMREWLLIGNDLHEGHDRIQVSVEAPKGTKYVDAWVNGTAGIRLEKSDGRFSFEMDTTELAPGEYPVVFAADGEETGFASFRVKRSHPLYVVVTTDWDDADTSDEALALQDDLHAEHPELLLTHFVGPYTFTDPEVSEDRREILVDWLKGMEENYTDEIGLHIHPYCNFVDQVDELLGVDPIPCITDQSTVYSTDSSGYTIRCGAYSEEEFTNLLLASDVLFEENGLGKPTSFRAGGWTAEIHTLRAMANAGYVADTSANNWARMEEWNGPFMGTLYSWNRENWSTINDTSQPYYPSNDNILETGPDYVPVLEVPDNGILVDYVSTQEMIDIFEANWPGGVLEVPTNYSIGYHPSNFNPEYKRTFTDALSHVDLFLASNDEGPVVYGRLSDMIKVWKEPQ